MSDEPREVTPDRAATSPPVQTIAHNAALLSLGTLASRLLGMARETLIAATFDVASTDAWFVALRIPNALRSMFAEGAARYVFNPVLGDELHGTPGVEEDRPRLREALGRVRGAMAAVLVLVSLLGIAFARPIFALISGGFHGDAARFELGVSVLRALFPFIFFMGWFALGNSVLQLLNRFRPGAFAPVMLNVAFLVLPYPLLPLLRFAHLPSIHALVIAALAGAALQSVWLRPALIREGMNPKPVLAYDRTVRRIAGLFLPELYGQAVYQLNIVLAGRYLSDLPQGSATFFSYAQRLADIPQGLFSVALSGAAAAAMQRDASRRNREGVARTYESAIRMAAFVALPMCVLMAVLGRAIVPIVYGYGRFRRLGGGGLDEIAASLRWQSIGIAFLAFVHQTTAVFGAFAKRRIVVIAATASVVTFVSLGYVASHRWGHVGVAMASAGSTAVQLACLLYAVRLEIRPNFQAVGPSLARVLGATGVAALAARAAVEWLPIRENTFRAKLLAITCSAACVVLYLAAAWIFRCPEITALRDMVRKRLRAPRAAA